MNTPRRDQAPSFLERWHNRWFGPLFAVIGAVAAVFGIALGIKQCSAPPQETAVDDVRPYAASSGKIGSGPAREVYPGSNPPDEAEFNSIFDNPVHGDERNFTLCRRAGSDDTYSDLVALADGESIQVYVYVSNSAVPPEKAIVDARMEIVTDPAAVDDPRFNVVLEGTRQSDGKALKVWDSCGVNSDLPVRLVLVPGSGEVHLYSHTDDPIPVSDSVLKGRDPLPGYGDGPPGTIPGVKAAYGYFLFEMIAVGDK